MAKNYFSDYPERTDILKNRIDLKSLVEPLEDLFGEKGFYSSPEEAMEVYEETLSQIGRICTDDIAPTAENIDRVGCKFDPKEGKVELPEQLLSHMKKCAELGLFAGPNGREFGGFNLPRVVLNMALEMIGQACPNTALTVACFSMGTFIEAFGTEEQKQRYLPKILTNEWTTSMALTEPGAGSDLGKLRTSAKRDGDHYLINGIKHFITNGDSDITFCLARTEEGSEWLKGLSVLIVPRKIDGKDEPNFKVTKIEEKVCLHGSPTCELVFENSVGYLLGGEGEGFHVMAHLMNEARLAMAALALGVCQSAHDDAKEYAKTRVTMGKPIFEHPMVADMLYEMETEIRAMRELIAEAGIAYDWMRIYEKRGDKKNLKKWKKRYRRLTPLAKYITSERIIPITRNALQILGGYGVCKDYSAERYFRESVIYAIYEGTSQIQSLMVLKDTLKDVATQSGGFLGSLAGAWAESKVTRDPIRSKLLEARNELNQAIRTVLGSLIKQKFRSDIDALKEKNIQAFLKEFSVQLFTPKTDLTYPFLWAERLTRIVSDYYTLKCMVDHHTAGDTEHQKWVLEFAEIVLPRMRKENAYMVNRLPTTLQYIEDNKAQA